MKSKSPVYAALDLHSRHSVLGSMEHGGKTGARMRFPTEANVMGIPRERDEITERKKSLAGLMSNIAEIGGANVERKIGKASVRDAIIGTGVAIERCLR